MSGWSGFLAAWSIGSRSAQLGELRAGSLHTDWQRSSWQRTGPVHEIRRSCDLDVACVTAEGIDSTRATAIRPSGHASWRSDKAKAQWPSIALLDFGLTHHETMGREGPEFGVSLHFSSFNSPSRQPDAPSDLWQFPWSVITRTR